MRQLVEVNTTYLTLSKHILCEIIVGNTWPQLNRINKWVWHIECFAIKSSKESPQCARSGRCCWLLYRNNSIYVDWVTKSISFHFTISSLFLPNKMAVVKPLHNLLQCMIHVVCQKLLQIEVVLFLASLVFRDWTDIRILLGVFGELGRPDYSFWEPLLEVVLFHS